MKSLCWDNVDYPITQPWLPPLIHDGIDIGCPSGTIIKAARAGRVETVQTGIVGVHVDGSGQRDFYVHGYSLVVVGQHVSVGTPVIHSDTVQADPRFPLTGPHLHFEVQDGFTLPGAPPQFPGKSLDPVPVLEGVVMTVSEKRVHLRHAYKAGLGRSIVEAEMQIWLPKILDDGSNIDAIVAEIHDSLEGLQWQAKLNTVGQSVVVIPAGTKFSAVTE